MAMTLTLTTAGQRLLMRSQLVTAASHLTPLIQLLYTFVIDDIQNPGTKANSETALEINSLAKPVLKVWQNALPNLKDTINAVISGNGKEEQLQALGQNIKSILGAAKGDTSIPHEDLEVFTALGAYFRSKSQTALNKLIKLASASQSPWIVQRLAPQATDQGGIKQKLMTVVKKLVGRNDVTLTMDEAQQVKELQPDAYKQYLALRREFNQSWKDTLVSFIRKSGKDLVDYDSLIEYLHLNGIDHMLPVGFKGLVDDRGRLYTKKGELIDGVPQVSTFPIITMNPTYGKEGGGDWVFRADKSKGEPGAYFYTTTFKKAQAKKKFAKVADLSRKMESMRRKWFGEIKHFAPNKESSVAAVILELLYEFSARIGSLGNAAGGQSTYGIGTLLVKHAIADGTGNITLRYKGKDGVATTHKLLKADPEQRIVINALHRLLEDKDPKDRIFTVDKGARKVPLNAGAVNKYFRALGAGETSVHKIRTYHGTKIFQELLNQLEASGKKPKNEKEAMAVFKSMAEAVGKKLNHVRRGAGGTKVTGMTALQAYIDPVVQATYWRNLGYRPPRYLEKFDV